MAQARLKMLRQGRGAGFLAVLEGGPSAAADVLDCVLHDPRWDRQLEDREAYYAKLLLAAGASVEPIRRFVVEGREGADDSDFWLPIGVLAEMCRRGSLDARNAVSAAVASGTRWRDCLAALAGLGGAALVERVVTEDAIRSLVADRDAEELAAAVDLFAAPWERWAQAIPALRFAVEGRAGIDRPVRALPGPLRWAAPHVRPADVPDASEDLGSLSTQRLIEQAPAKAWAGKLAEELLRRWDEETERRVLEAATSGNDAQRSLALRVLGKRGFTGMIDDAVAFLRSEVGLDRSDRSSPSVRRSVLSYLADLPADVTLPLARDWFLEPFPVRLAGEKILALHATADDRRMLQHAGAAALESNDMYRVGSIVEALTVAGPDASISFLADVYTEAPYAWARRRTVEALCRCEPSDVVHGLVTEALWDCEPDARELACGAAHALGEPRVDRLEELVSDPYEDDLVRQAAQRAVEQIS